MKNVLGITLCLVLLSGSVWAQVSEPKLGVDLDATFVSKYMWYGYDVYDDHGAFQPSVNLDLYETGFNLNFWGSMPFGGGNDDLNEIDYTIGYSKTFYDDEMYALDFKTNFIYYQYPRWNHKADAQELGARVAMPKLLSIGEYPLIPSYYVGLLWPNSSGVGADVAGAFHVLALNCPIPAACPFTGQEHVINLFTNITYNDGAYGADHDWSHMTFGVSTSMAVGEITVTPALYYQHTMDESIKNFNANGDTDSDEEFWAGLSLSYSF
ncbi:MAG: hypothetical protein JW860_13470 [Sedimentisphaerales bacterium]|nr:hypothetical protein [Sedimentisphaerales bacterium]